MVTLDLVKHEAGRLLKQAAARQLSLDHPGRTVRVVVLASGRTSIRFDDDQADGEPIAAYRFGRLVPVGGTTR